jgi:hypothetical protein
VYTKIIALTSKATYNNWLQRISTLLQQNSLYKSIADKPGIIDKA